MTLRGPLAVVVGVLVSTSGGAGAAQGGSSASPQGDEARPPAGLAPLLLACKDRSPGAACSASVGRESFDGLCVAFPAEGAGAVACVPQPASCTPICGGTGQSCCTPDDTCQSGLACQGGTCAPVTPPTCDVSTALESAIAAALPATVCLGRLSVGGTLSIETCRRNSATCTPGCVANLTWDRVVFDTASGQVGVFGTVNATIDVRQSFFGVTTTCTATLSGPVRVFTPVSVVAGTGGSTQLTPVGTPSFDVSGVNLTGCESVVQDPSLLDAVLDAYLGTLVVNFSGTVLGAISGASASCPP